MLSVIVCHVSAKIQASEGWFEITKERNKSYTYVKKKKIVFAEMQYTRLYGVKW